jgi:uncharacterized protein
MKYRNFLKSAIMLTVLFFATGNLNSRPIRLMIITGGHDYQEEPFNQLFESLGEKFTYQVVKFPEAFSVFKPENRNDYDALVFYHMWQEITGEDKKNLSECISRGKPLVVMHHSICGFDNWPEYLKIAGGKYFTKATLIDGVEYNAGTYKHDVKISVEVVDSKHPVTKGIKDFEIIDETYNGLYFETDVIPLLRTNESTSSPVIAWTKKYGKAKVVTLQGGHDRQAFENPNFRKLLKQAILYVWNKS